METELGHKLLLDLPDELESERLILRKYSKGDGGSFFDLLESNNNREYLREHVDEAISIKNAEEAEIRIRELEADWISRERFVMGVWLKELDNYVGQIWIEPRKWDVPSFELGWFLDRLHQGKGIATEAAKRSMRFLFEDLRAHKVIVLTRDNNEKSSKLAERLGFKREGHLRESGIENGRRYGLFHYGLLKEEFERLGT
ncbi:MAG: GNAT family N-acetyltransferase [Candidatus Thorarchaeota archaeon]|jgi:RimJ/RimL family protein N-acetyltransferase